MEYNDRTLKLIEKNDEKKDGANSATVVWSFVCPCGKGEIEYCMVPGFDDQYATIKCRKCKKKFTINYGRGTYFELEEK